MSMWAESSAQDRGTLPGGNVKDLGSEGLRRAWNQMLAAVRPEYRRTHYASLSKAYAQPCTPLIQTSDACLFGYSHYNACRSHSVWH